MKIDKEMCHPSHPKHKLKLVYTEIPFNCDGCKEAGIGLKYRCQHPQCEFDLHKACAVAPPITTHPFYTKCEFHFYYTPPGPVLRRCDACNKGIQGFVYHCKRCDFDLHPCCLNLPQVLDDGKHNLYLCMKMMTRSQCHMCGGGGGNYKGHGWSYRSHCKTYNLHVSCVKELLVESWQAMYLNVDKNKVREIQTKIPTLKGTLKNHHHTGAGTAAGKVGKCCEMAGGAVRVIVSAILGDPTAIIAAVVGGFISK